MSEAASRRPRKKPPQPPVHVRGRGQDAPRGLRELPDDFRRLAQGDRLPRRAPRPVLRDERVEALVPGVANRDARTVFDARVERLIAARDSQDEGALAQGLAEAFRMGLWRGQNVVSFDVFLEDVVGIDPRTGRKLAEEGARALGCALQRADDRVIATWFRAEVALRASEGACRVELRGSGADERLVLSVPADRGDLWLAEVGKRVVAIAKYLPSEPAPRRRTPPRS